MYSCSALNGAMSQSISTAITLNVLREYAAMMRSVMTRNSIIIYCVCDVRFAGSAGDDVT